MGEWWNGEEKIITEDPVRQSDSLLLEIFMKICPWKLLVFGSQSFPCDFLRNILRKIPQRGDNKMHFIKWFFFWVWHGISLSHIFTVDCNSSSSKADLTDSASVTLCLVSYKSFQTRPLSKDQPSPGDKAHGLPLASIKADSGDSDLRFTKVYMKNSILSPQERSSGETPVLWTHLKGKRLDLY